MTRPNQLGDVSILKPCPFCGGEAQRITISEEDEPNNAGGDVICCTRCQASSHVEFGRKENLVSRWNTRSPEAAAIISKLVEALKAHDRHMSDELGYSGPDDPGLDPFCAEDWARIREALSQVGISYPAGTSPCR